MLREMTDPGVDCGAGAKERVAFVNRRVYFYRRAVRRRRGHSALLGDVGAVVVFGILVGGM